MKYKEFHFLTNWKVRGDVERVYDILIEPEDFANWWPEVYLKVDEIKPGNDYGVGRIVKLLTKGKLPYTLKWQAECIMVEKPNKIVIKARGDLEGRGVWDISQKGEFVEINYDWTVVANKSWMKLLSPVLKKVFELNHNWAMKKGEKGLKQKLSEN